MAVLRFLKIKDFEERVRALSPKIMFYDITSAPLRNPPIAMRLLFYHGGDVYVFLDFPSREQATFRETELHVRDHEKETAYVDEGDIEEFIAKHFEGVKTVSLGVIGGPSAGF